MSENSPRWPGSDGSPGLDFSPYRKAALSEAGRTASSAPTKSASSAPDASSTRITPSAKERAERTAKEWAAAPVAGAPSAAPVAPPAPVSSPSADEKTGVLGRLQGPVSAESAAEKTAVAPVAAARKPRRTRKARLRLSRIDPWSVMKTTFLFAIAFGVMLVVAVFVLWSVLAGSGALESVNTLINTLIGDADTAFKIEDYLSVSRVLGFAVLIAAIDVVIITAVATLFAFLYNLSAVVMGGLEVTLAED
ncbi:DUF3566 domain-containing protein [Tessaracoccus palaemonis]|uniref:DUF3566 domain-containing protein n=1 Tax=Tessaracoccus palaemonis TaxID=2829499 RepID=A0ABX8SJ68_9ACTN|nr:DUF3566 domain-containing protein [Tessaracoccus palaemonis]QXT62929.1 DUF3566 domain-containing protein [Tessaracoccus palaemonis]